MRIVVVARVRLYREGLTLVLRGTSRIEVVGVAAGQSEGVAIVAALRPTIALVDAGMATRRGVVRAFQQAYDTVKVVAFGVQDDTTEILLCAEAGVAGYVPNEAGIAELIQVLTAVERGELWCSSRVAATLLRRVTELSQESLRPKSPSSDGPGRELLTVRELQIVSLVEQGLMNKEIARRLGISLSTVKNHVHNILEKAAVSSRRDLALRPRPTR